MLLLFGTRRSNKILGQANHDCPNCRRPSSFAYVKTSRWFTLFFIPVIPLGSSVLTVCGLCGFRVPTTEPAAQHALAAAQLRHLQAQQAYPQLAAPPRELQAGPPNPYRPPNV